MIFVVVLKFALKQHSANNTTNKNTIIQSLNAPQIFYYRKDLFENTALKNDYERENNISLRPPSTLKEFNTIADFFTNKTTAISYGISIPTAYSECLTPEIYMRLRSYGGSLFNRHGNVLSLIHI